MNAKLRLLSAFLILSVLLALYIPASAESGSASASDSSATVEIDLSSVVHSDPPVDSLIKYFNDIYHTDSYQTLPMTEFDRQHGMVVSLTTENTELPDADIYVFPKHGMTVEQYAKQEAHYHRTEAFLLRDTVPETWFFVSAQIFDNIPYIAYTALQDDKKNPDSFIEVVDYFKTKKHPLGNTSHTIELPPCCAEIPVTDEQKALGVVKSFRTDAVLPFSTYGNEVESIYTISSPIPEGKTLEDLIMSIFDPNKDDVEYVTIYHMHFIKAAGRYENDPGLIFIVYLFEENGSAEGIVFNYRNTDPNGFDGAVMDFVDFKDTISHVQ